MTRTKAAPSFARTGWTSPFGKFDSWIRPTRIESAVQERFKARVAEACRAAGIASKAEAEAVRDMYRVAALGREEAVRVYGEGVLVVLKTITGMSNTN